MTGYNLKFDIYVALVASGQNTSAPHLMFLSVSHSFTLFPPSWRRHREADPPRRQRSLKVSGNVSKLFCAKDVPTIETVWNRCGKTVMSTWSLKTRTRNDQAIWRSSNTWRSSNGVTCCFLVAKSYFFGSTSTSVLYSLPKTCSKIELIWTLTSSYSWHLLTFMMPIRSKYSHFVLAVRQCTWQFFFLIPSDSSSSVKVWWMLPISFANHCPGITTYQQPTAVHEPYSTCDMWGLERPWMFQIPTPGRPGLRFQPWILAFQIHTLMARPKDTQNRLIALVSY